MYSFGDYQFWFFTLLFIPVVFVTFFLPGFFIINKAHRLSVLSSFILAIVLGIVLWGVQGYIFGYLQLRFLSYLYILLSVIWGIQERKEIGGFLQKTWYEIKKLDRFLLFLLLVGLVLQVLPMAASGMRFFDGVRFYFVNEADGVMHLSYIQSIIRSFPPQEPGAVGLPLVNYHYWSDLVIAELSRVFMLPVIHLFFQYMPVLISLITGLVVYCVIRAWGGSITTSRFALLLLFFSGDSAYLVYYALHQSIAFHTPAIDNGVTQFFNMPHAFAKMIFLSGLLPLHYWITTKKYLWGLLTIAFFAPLVGFKVYYGLFAAFGFTCVVAGLYSKSVYGLLKKKISFSPFIKGIILNKNAIFFLLLFALVSSLIYFPPNSGSGGLIFSPLEWPKLLLGEQALNFREWWLRMQVYEQAGNTRNVVILNTLALAIALVSIHGTRLLGFLPNRTLYKNVRFEGLLFFIPGILLFTFLGFFTLQESGLFNVFNFFIVTLVVLSLFAAFTLRDLMNKKSMWAKVLIVLFIVVTLPRVIFEIGGFISTYASGQYRLISNDELDALTYLREKTPEDSIVQSHPKNSLDSVTPYVSFFSNRQTYFTGGGLLSTHNQPIEKREQHIQDIFMEPNANEFADSLYAQNISYVYIKKDKEEILQFEGEEVHLHIVFENDSMYIYKVTK